MKKITYISLFSGGGVGCFGMKQLGFNCIATVELLDKRLEIQRINKKCKYDSGYISGDIKEHKTKEKVYKEINKWKALENLDNVDILIATPPCQGMSTANSKKKSSDLVRNSLVVESIEMIDKIGPNFFIMENVPAFLKTDCIDSYNNQQKIGDFLYQRLSKDYSIYHDVINFKDYGVASSRNRCLVIGVKHNLSTYISPLELFPDICEKKITIKDSIYKFERLKIMGEISKNDIFHFFRPYDKKMINWIDGLKEGMSSFENENISNRPHKIVNGEIVENKNKVGGKYKRQSWDQVAPCIHTRNDALASQNTIHPEDNRVFSIRELMKFMSVPNEFKWSNISEKVLNNLDLNSKLSFLKQNELNIRQILGEAVPTLIFKKIGEKILFFLSEKKIKEYNLTLENEILNPNRLKNEAFYTDKFLVNEIIKNLPNFDNIDTLNILEPSVGLGSFLPLLIKKYSYVKKINIDVIDIDNSTLEVIKNKFNKKSIPENVTIKFYNYDFLKIKLKQKYDIVIGNPPFRKMIKWENDLFKKEFGLKKTSNIISFFLLKSISIGKFVSLVLPKNFLISPQYNELREYISKFNIKSILDFENLGFNDVLIETISLLLETNKTENNNIKIINIKTSNILIQNKKYISENLPNWVIYRSNKFDRILESINTNIFKVTRDRQITNKFLINHSSESSIPVLRSRNLSNERKIIEIPNYDKYIETKTLSDNNFSIAKFLNDVESYICPNFTTNIRVIKKPKNVLVNGSLAVFKLIKDINISESDLKWFSSNEFKEFYRISNNFQKNTLNIDSNSIFYFGVKKYGS